MAIQTVSVPDMGGTEGAEVIELSIAVGDVIEEEQSIIVLETDKASMDIPSPLAGKVTAIKVNIGDKVSEGNALIEIDAESDIEQSDTASDNKVESVEKSEISEPGTDSTNTVSTNSGSSNNEINVVIPDGAEGAEVIEIIVGVGDEVAEGDSLIVLETDKASMEIPAPQSGKVLSLSVKQGDKAVEGAIILTLAVDSATIVDDSEAQTTTSKESVEESAEAVIETAASSSPSSSPVMADSEEHSQSIITASQSKEIYAGPAIRKFSREMAIDLTQVTGTGERGRITKDDVKAYVKQVMTGKKAAGGLSATINAAGAGIPAVPPVDFSQFGDIEMVPMSKIKKLTATNMSRNWLNIPHVTQFDDADITDLETFRQSLKPEAEKRGVKLTPLPFLLKACAAALVAEPSFNVSLHHDGEHIVQKNYVNIGVAVDSPIGLVVPVIRDVDKKGLWELAAEFMEVIDKARNAKLGPKDMQGGCFTISSLGAMGGQGFTPIVNAPEVAILGVSKAEIKPKWNGSEFEPRNMLPLSLSYDHRAINGGDAGRFFSYLNSVIADVRRLLL